MISIIIKKGSTMYTTIAANLMLIELKPNQSIVAVTIHV